jgi:hypothetical protein
MQLVLHTGVHYTEEERLMKCLLRNREDLQARDTVVPRPASYRALVRNTLNAMHRKPPADDAREVLLELILDGSTADRVILSDPNFFRTPGTAVLGGVLYPDAPQRMMHMAQLFPEDDVAIFLAIRNPAALLPILHGTALDNSDETFWGDRTPIDVRWSETIEAIREAAPRAALTVWCNEDTPLIWSQIIREMAGLEPNEKIQGGFDLLNQIMSKEGMMRFRSYLDTHPDMSEFQKRRVIAAFLDKFALPEEIEEELDMPGWTDDLVEELTALYDEDLGVIQRIPGVRVITP